MKNLLFAMLILLIPTAGIAQQQTVEKSPEHYLKKAKMQKALGTVVISVGATSAIIGTAMIIEDNKERTEFLDGLGRQVGAAFVVTGILVGGSSYLLYNASRKNRAKYEGLQPVVGIIRNPTTNQSATTVGIAVNF